MQKTILLISFIGFAAAVDKLEEVFAWKELSFTWPSDQAKETALKNGDYVPANNLPLGLERWNDKLFITIPRWKSGVAASLGYVSLNSPDKTAAITPYPNWDANCLPKTGENLSNNSIVSTFRVKADACDRLWMVDTGLADILGDAKQISKPAIVVFDLKTDTLIRRYTLKDHDLKEDSFFANIIVDVSADKCDDAFAYIPDLGGYGIVVYSWAENDSWRVKHNYFHFDPLKGDLTVADINFQWTDGVFGLALGPRDSNGYRTLYFHPLASTREFSVNTQVLRNKTIAQDPHSYNLYTILGERGDNTQSSASDFDEKSNVLFLTQLQRDGVACWNPRKKLAPENLALIAQDKEALIFTNDLKLDKERNLWILSDRMAKFIYDSLNPNEINYRIFKAKADELIAGTPCAA